ncbi:MAG TPA: MmgE/PrpD family protein [Terriglobales bacterium]|nr:MmgE/PrpD family protein [Terriglobales bacterium]
MNISRRKAMRISGATMVGMSVRRLASAFAFETGEKPRGVAAANGTHDTLSRQLARWVVKTRFEDLPKPIVEAWKTIVLDSIAVGFVGSKDRLARAMSDVAHKLGGTAECTVINSKYRTDPGRAAWLNGTLIGTPQSDSPSHAHAASNVVPAIMAIAERDRLDGKAFLAALILGGEVGGRIEATGVGVETTRGFHNPAVQGPFSAAAAVGKLLGLDEDTMVNALGIAGSSSAGLQEFAFEGADMKATHLGRATQLGLESALLAAAGVLGPSTVLEGPFGYFNGFSLPTDPHRVVENLGVQALAAPWHKLYAVHTNHQQIVDALVRFKAERPSFRPEDLRRVIVRGPESVMERRHAVPEPTTIMGGKYSTPFTTAVALFRDISDPLNYDDTAIHDRRIRDLAQRVELVTTDGAGDRANGGDCEITLETAGAEHYVLPTRTVKGFPGNPFTFDDGIAKFRQWTRRIIPERQSLELIESVRGLEEVRDMAAVVRATAARS